MDGDPRKNAASWFYNQVFREQSIPPRKEPSKTTVPSPIRAARALARGGRAMSREALFLQQAKLLASYEDEFPVVLPPLRYRPTYESLNDLELRSYFAWRTLLRRGELHKTCQTFVFLYAYEILNQIGVADPLDGYWRLRGFQAAYGQLDDSLDAWLETWLIHYAVYHSLHPSLLADTNQAQQDRCIALFHALPAHTDEEIMEVLRCLVGPWFDRSKFYRENPAHCDRVICNVLRGMHAHYSRGKRNFVQQLFGDPGEFTVWMFQDAVFCPKPRPDGEYALDPLCVYRCKRGYWTVIKYGSSEPARKKLTAWLRAIDGILRESFACKAPIKYTLDVKWQEKLIRAEVQALLDAKQAEEEARQAAENARLKLDMSRLDQIRKDAAVTRDKLIVEEEMAEEPAAPAPVETPEPDTPLSKAEYRYLQCLLYGRPTDWVRSEGLMVSVLTDGINEKLYDTFCDSVLEEGEVVADYTEDLKEMVLP